MKANHTVARSPCARELKPVATDRIVSRPSTGIDMTRSGLKLKRILVPTDFSEASLKALRYAVRFAEQFGATICLVHVIEPASFINDLPNVVLVKSNEEQDKEAHKQLISLAQKEIEELVPVSPQVRIGKAFHEIVELAKALETDLIIMATHGHKGLAHVLLGSTAERVARYAPCPVLVVREHEREFL